MSHKDDIIPRKASTQDVYELPIINKQKFKGATKITTLSDITNTFDHKTVKNMKKTGNNARMIPISIVPPI